ncbi:MAG: hypothetical protein ACTSPQ_19260 [Candidatus Helarchaeota archaeon]
MVRFKAIIEVRIWNRLGVIIIYWMFIVMGFGIVGFRVIVFGVVGSIERTGFNMVLSGDIRSGWMARGVRRRFYRFWSVFIIQVIVFVINI